MQRSSLSYKRNEWPNFDKVFMLGSAETKRWNQIFQSRPWKSLCALSIEAAEDKDLANLESMAKRSRRSLPASMEDARITLPEPKVLTNEIAQVYQSYLSTLTVDVSILTPHLIQNISPELLKTLQYMPAEVSNRSISMLQGPDTNFAAIRAAIKAVDRLESTDLPLVVYSRDGAAHSMNVECRPVLGADHKPCGCQIRMVPLASPGAGRDLRSNSAPTAEALLRRLYRSQDRFRTGLSIQQDLNKTACRQASPPGGPAGAL